MSIDDIIENARLKGRIIALEAELETRTAEVKCLEAVVRTDSRLVKELNAELTKAADLIGCLQVENDHLKTISTK